MVCSWSWCCLCFNNDRHNYSIYSDKLSSVWNNFNINKFNMDSLN